VQETASTTVLKTLVSAGVIEENGETIALSKDFQAQVEDERVTKQYSGPPVDEVVDPETIDEEYKRQLRTYVGALGTFDLDLTDRETVAAASGILQTVDGPATGDNDLSVTVDGERFSTLVETGEDVLALIYKEDCEPCERVRSKLQRVEDEGDLPSDVVVVEIPGPENKYHLHDEFDVVGAPTLLFCQNGRVEMRLTGDVHLKQIRSDVNRLYD
jgi:thiol-disulfide isomerase/thioredoxin